MAFNLPRFRKAIIVNGIVFVDMDCRCLAHGGPMLKTRNVLGANERIAYSHIRTKVLAKLLESTRFSLCQTATSWKSSAST